MTITHIEPSDVPLSLRRAIADDLHRAVKARNRHRMTIGPDGARELADALLARFPGETLKAVIGQEQENGGSG